MELLTLSGSPYERGYTYGSHFATITAELVEKNRLSLQNLVEKKGLTPLSDERFANLVRKGLPYAMGYASDLVEEVRGIASGAGLEFEQVFGLNYFLDLFDLTYPQSSTELLFGCTTFAAAHSATADNGVYLGQNYDLRGLFQKGILLIRLNTAPNLTTMLFTIAGLVGCAGMNSAGLGIVINNLTPSDSHPGVPYTFVLRKALEQRTMADAINVIISSRRASGINYLLADANGEILSLETTATKAEIIYALEEYVGHTNHYVHPRLLPYDAPSRPYNGDSYVRWSRINKLLRQRRGHITLQDLMSFAKDHVGYPQSICRHPLPGLSELQTGNTISSMIMDLRRLSLWITTGNPCQNAYERHNLEPVT
ncbi:MAG: C45 family peptidase [Chloroflexi bacterium]|nr:C45 family peptidase [Chloroflexota bacterium]